FTTIADTTAPTITGTSPINGATGVLVSSTVMVTFSEDMNPTTVNGSTFMVRTTVGSIAVAGTVSYNAATRIATFTPTAALAPSTNYTVTVTTGAKDLAGNGLTGNFTFAFTTGP
ncbi:MAG: Ig-like domain-containing protein, partial [Gemmatimonadaceae bacterium]